MRINPMKETTMTTRPIDKGPNIILDYLYQYETIIFYWILINSRIFKIF